MLKVKNGEVFKVGNTEYKQFEFHLKKSRQKKVGIINNSLLVKKLNSILRERKQPELGFTEFDITEQSWLYKIARYIDTTNLLEFFEEAPYPEPPLSDSTPAISRIYYGRVYAGQWLFRSDKVRKNKKMWEAFTLLSEKHKSLNSFKINVEILEHELRETRNKVSVMEAKLHDMIGKVAITYTSLKDPKITTELIISGGQELIISGGQELTDEM